MALRINDKGTMSSSLSLALEGSISGDWVDVLEKVCQAALKKHSRVSLDLSGVTFVSDDGAEMLARLPSDRVQIANCSELIRMLIAGG